MQIVILVMYIVVFLMVLLITFFQHVRNIKLRKSIGEIYIKWSVKFNFSFLQGKFRWLIIAVGIGFILHWILYHRDQNYGHAFIMSISLAFSFYPWWIVKVGKKGIIVSMKIINWVDVEYWQESPRGNLKLLVLKLNDADSNLKIRIPQKYIRDINDILMGLIPDKAI
jgi:hypothetical protein